MGAGAGGSPFVVVVDVVDVVAVVDVDDWGEDIVI
jgi:hypothetical protein